MIGVDELLGPDGVIPRRLPDFEERPEQLAMAHAVAKALAERRHLIAEAGTGIGKSFAYLLPAAAWADAHQGQGPVVISTRTIALQEQLEKKDLPFLHAVLPFEWSSVTALGRNNYVCLRRLDLAGRDQLLFEDKSRQGQLQQLREWSVSASSGSRHELPTPPDAEVWEEVQAEHGNCLQRACQFYDACHWQRARRRMQTAQVLVVNHALYCADIALRMAGASYLPEHRVVIFDEAHHLERVATESLGYKLSGATVGWHLKRLYGRSGQRGVLARFGTPDALLLHQELRLMSDSFFAELDARLQASGSGDGISLHDEILDAPLPPILRSLAALLLGIAQKQQQLDARMELNARAEGLLSLAMMVQSLCQPKPDQTVPLVRWLEPSRHGAALCGAPLDVSAALKEHLFGAGRTAVLTSATLGPTDDHEFTWLRRRLGLHERVDTLRLGSPFDFQRAVELQIAEAMPDPSQDPHGYRREVAARTEQAVLDNGGRALILCTSWDFVRRLAEQLRPALEYRGIELLVQGEAPLAQLLHRKHKEPTSVLIGTDSLWEGIDVRGSALTLVVVTRLPFQSPGHPLTKARLAAITARGGDAFMEHSLPEAILKFRQGFGRLIRSQQDRGKVLVLDPRARTKAYGRRFLASLPLGEE